MANNPMPARTWDDEERYWKDGYSSRPYGSGTEFENWRPAYRFGYESSQRYTGRNWTDVESDLEREWGSSGAEDSRSTWQQAKDAVKDAWDRMTADDRTADGRR